MINNKPFTAPSNDVIFKALFANENNKKPLISLLSGILGMPFDYFNDLTIMNNEITPDHIDFKQSRLDIRVKLKDQTEIDIEIQLLNHIAFKERALYYWSNMYSRNLGRGSFYKKLNKCIVINLVYFELFKTERMHSKFKVMELHDHYVFTDHLEIHTIELIKLNDYNKSIENELLIDWAEFLRLGNEDDLMKLSERTDLPVEIQNAIKDLEKIQDDPDKYWEALNKQIFVMDMVQAFDDATEKGVRLGKEVGMEEGRREGKQLGIQEGRQEGLEQGHNEEKLNIARKMKENGFDSEAIKKITDLEIDLIDSL